MVPYALLAGLVLNAVTTAGQEMTSAPVFVPLGEQTAFNLLDPCGKRCLVEANKYGEEAAAKSNCLTLDTGLGSVHVCETATCSSGATSDYEAQAVLATYCTAIASNYSITIPTAIPTLVNSTGGAVVQTLTSSQGSVAASTGITQASAQTAASPATGVDPVPTSATPSPPSATSFAESTSTGTSIGTSIGASTSGTANTTNNHKSGFTSHEKVGVGLGVGLGLPILFGIIAALFLFTRRRKSRSAGPYGPVMTSEKGVNESGSYSSPHVQPHEMQHLGSAAPFLPAIITHDFSAKEPTYQQTPQTGHSFEQQAHPYEQQAQTLQPDPYARSGRAATSRNVSGASTPPLDTQARPANAPRHRELVEDEPPSPVSPVSQISTAGSRPASLRHRADHDL
ncbi:hypothetical protein LTR36_000527 [Oleoguttula mirabilis]|uniref:Uncharacterized protein n=1 Tax=Oleoguttula mirabilis TaxID=1507867 RepID=A0AAV9JQ08_9PEZI|nr:hypothetical protein LTR36_000527 [Oleoguttula mirabilis]